MPAVDKTKKDVMAPRRTLRKVWPEDVPAPPPVVGVVVASMTVGQCARRACAEKDAMVHRIGGRANSNLRAKRQDSEGLAYRRLRGVVAIFEVSNEGKSNGL